jgi:hypothetical protein
MCEPPPDASGGHRQSESQAAESPAIVAGGLFVDDQVQLSTPLDVDQSPASFRGRIRFFAQGQLHDRQPRRVTGQPRHQRVGIVREQEVADHDAE